MRLFTVLLLLLFSAPARAGGLVDELSSGKYDLNSEPIAFLLLDKMTDKFQDVFHVTDANTESIESLISTTKRLQAQVDQLETRLNKLLAICAEDHFNNNDLRSCGSK